MIKLRLHDTREENKRFAEFLKRNPRVQVNSCSEGYPDRGESVYERVYMDVELKPIAGINPEFEKLFKDIKAVMRPEDSSGKMPAPKRRRGPRSNKTQPPEDGEQ